ncbi:hypothetical protein DFJ74DRAFT_721628, partial [Hyaloraphidium curvatum]
KYSTNSNGTHRPLRPPPRARRHHGLRRAAPPPPGRRPGPARQRHSPRLWRQPPRRRQRHAPRRPLRLALHRPRAPVPLHRLRRLRVRRQLHLGRRRRMQARRQQHHRPGAGEGRLLLRRLLERRGRVLDRRRGRLRHRGPRHRDPPQRHPARLQPHRLGARRRSPPRAHPRMHQGPLRRLLPARPRWPRRARRPRPAHVPQAARRARRARTWRRRAGSPGFQCDRVRRVLRRRPNCDRAPRGRQPLADLLRPRLRRRLELGRGQDRDLGAVRRDRGQNCQRDGEAGAGGNPGGLEANLRAHKAQFLYRAFPAFPLHSCG